METKEKKVVYIAGPITGVDRYWEAFEKAEEELEAAGFIALTPTRLPKGLIHAQYMHIDKAMIDVADAVMFLPGWSNSRGAREEFDYVTNRRTPYVTHRRTPYGFTVESVKEVLSLD